MSFFLRNANTKTLSEQAPSVPNVSEALASWFQNVSFIKVRKMTKNFELVETSVEIAFQGIVENLSAQALLMKPEGQRKWEWLNVWSGAELDLKVDEIFKYGQKNYRVTSKNNWVQYGYSQFEAVEDYTP